MDTNKQTGSIDQIDINLLDLDKAEFYVAESGFTGLKYDGEDHKHITLKRALPVGRPMEYISVADQKNKEIGILRAVDELNDEQFVIVMNELNRRYYCPEILEVKSVKDKLGYVYMELLLNTPDSTSARSDKKEKKSGTGSAKGFVKSCAVKDVNKNVYMLSDRRLIIFDVDGNRYIINDLSAIDKNSQRKLEPYLF